MNISPALPFCAALALLNLAAAPAPRPQQVVDAATRTVDALHAHLGHAYAPLLRQAKAVLIAPAGASGDAVLLLHARQGWGEPAFFDATALATKTPTVLLIMSERALDTVLHQGGLPLDGPDALTLAPLSAKAGAELLLWPGRHDTLDDAGFRQDDATNAAWYGHPRNAAEIVGATLPDLRSSRLRHVLSQGT
jgi:hypothetical protein